MSDCRDCIYKNEIYPLGNDYHCGKSGLDFEDGVRGPTCYCRHFYDTYNYMKDQDAIQERNKNDLLAIIMFGGDIFPDADESSEQEDSYQTEKDTDSDDSYTGFLILLSIAFILTANTWGFAGLKFFFVLLAVLLYLLYKTPLSMKHVVMIGVPLYVIACFAFTIVDRSVNRFDSDLSQVVFKEAWTKKENGEEYLFAGVDLPTVLPLFDRDKEINEIIYRYIESHNRGIVARESNRKAGFYVAPDFKKERSLEAYFVGERLIVISDNVPQRIKKAISERKGKRFDWQVYKLKREEKK